MRRTLVAAMLVGVLALPAAAAAQTSAGPPRTAPASLTAPPAGFTTSARDALRIADRTGDARSVRAAHPRVSATVTLWQNRRWDVVYRVGERGLLEVNVTAAGRVSGTWKGLQTDALYARAPGGPLLSSPFVLVGLALLSLVPFLDRHRRRRRLHLDLVALSGLTAGMALLDARRTGPALWVVYASLAYLAGRALHAAVARPRRRSSVLAWRVPTTALAVALALLVAGRIAVNVTSHSAVDVGAASLIGADRIMHGAPLYTDNEAHGDTYGPLNYVAYIPFELALPYRGGYTALAAAHAAAITFDLLTLLGLLLLGRRLRAGPRGRRLGLALAWVWAASPATLLTLQQSSDDALLAALSVWTLLAFSRPAARGALLGAAAAVKLFPALLLGALWRGHREDPRRGRTVAVVAFLAISGFAFAVYEPADGGVRALWNCTLGYQLSRRPDFSLWAQYPGLGVLKAVVVGAALALAAVVAFLPRGARSMPQAAGLAAAVTIALQLGGGHWFEFYACWFIPGLLVALFDATEPLDVAEPAVAGRLTAPVDEGARRAVIMV